VKFARWTLRLAGIYGLIVLVPHYFMEGHINEQHPPAIGHPEFFYGFLGVGIAWQIAFLIMAQDPVRFRPMLLPSVLEKFSFGIAAVALYFQQRVPDAMLAAGIIDLMWGVLFIIAWRLLRAK
jgi:hypothetical protein